MTTKKDITPTAPPNETDRAFSLLQTALAEKTDPETLERLVALQERILARNAENDFAQAMANFQAACPRIVKRQQATDRHGRVLYRFANLDGILEQIRPLLAEWGFSYSFNSDEAADGSLIVNCRVTHRGGHSIESRVKMPPTRGKITSAAQDRGIELAYGRRQAFVSAFGLTTADDADDADGGPEAAATIDEKAAAELKKRASSLGVNIPAFLAYLDDAPDFDQIRRRDYDRAVESLDRFERRQKRGELR